MGPTSRSEVPSADGFAMISDENQWYSTGIEDSNENQWYPRKIDDIRRKSMISDENQWYPTKINDIRRKSMISNENQWYPTKINDIRRESMMSDENQWYCTKINDIKRKQRYNYYIVIHIILLIMCKAIILISICIQVYDLCTDSIYPCYDDRWFSMIIDDGTPWWKYWFGVKQGLSRGWSGVDLGSIRGRVGVDQGSIWGQPGGHFTCFSWPSGVIILTFFWIVLFCIFPNHRRA